MSEIIITPTFSANEVNYVKEIITHINGIQRECSCAPTYFGSREFKHHCFKLFSKFIFRTSHYINGWRRKRLGVNEIIKQDPMECLNLIIKRTPKLKLDKFIIEKNEVIIPTIIPSNIDELEYRINYITIREEIIAFLQQTVGNSKELNELKELFVSNNSPITFDEYIIKKSKSLLDLDLSGYVDKLNEETNKKSKVKYK